ncbi:YqaJ viral recombinase family protein [Mesobacterium pallidum]|uniref:YqaJ viral recombinase family nuclease n=1 Tax=Mesobacterium pallidum TaxID=2872037 RepID=UPI001EE2EF8F|nr:YqaJ viral recombinase family protein [Mesobacterium pallidum]
MLDSTEEEWLARRRSGIGGSDIAAVLGLSPWSTPYDVWLDKLGQKEPLDPDSPLLYWGHKLEPLVADEYARRTDRKVQRVNALLRHPECDFAVANIDRAVINPEIAGNVRWRDNRLTTDRLLECKTSMAFASSKWGEAGTDDVPDYYLLQMQWYAGITGADVVDLAVLIGGNDYRIYTVQRDNEVFADMLEAADEFWQLVQQKIAPDPQSVADAMHRWPRHLKDKQFVVGVETFHAVQDYVDVKSKIKALETEAEALKVKIVTEFQDAEAIYHAGEKLATWKEQSSTRVDSKRLRAEHPDIFEACSTTSSTRVLRPAI